MRVGRPANGPSSFVPRAFARNCASLLRVATSSGVSRGSVAMDRPQCFTRASPYSGRGPSVPTPISPCHLCVCVCVCVCVWSGL